MEGEGIAGDLTYESFMMFREKVTAHCFRLFSPLREHLGEVRIQMFKEKRWGPYNQCIMAAGKEFQVMMGAELVFSLDHIDMTVENYQVTL